tara:strand:- start:1710 stop:2165 length:456 start_codon:yes stop_codon:yes gene_type:complete
MGNPLDIKFDTMEGTETSLRELGSTDTQKWVVVNVASACGMTRQYTQLQEISQLDEVIVVGFPCNQFGGQEPGTHEEICNFTSTKYNVDFPLMAKLEVKGGNQHPLFELLSQSTSGDGYAGDIRWNFEKFVITSDGNIRRYPSSVSPLDIV